MRFHWVPVTLLAVVPATGAEPLRTVASVRTSLLTEGQSSPEVLLEGVVTFRDRGSGLTYVQDTTGGVELRGVSRVLDLEQGSRVRVDGRLDGSQRIPGVTVEPLGVAIEGEEAVPVAIRFDADAAKSGEFDGRRMKVDGALVQIHTERLRGDKVWLRVGLRTAFGFFTGLVPWSESKPPPLDLNFSRVEVTGVTEAIFNNRGQRVGVLFLIPLLADIKVVQPPAANPFDKPTRQLSELMRPGLDDPLERVRIEGVVLHQSDSNEKPAYLRTSEGAVKVMMAEGYLVPGERVAVVGYADLLEKNVVLRDAVAEHLSTGPSPVPLERDVQDLLREGHDSDLVRIRGTVLRNALETPQGSLFVESDDRVVEVVLAGGTDREIRRELAEKLKAGTLLSVTGICELRGAMLVTGSVDLTDIRVAARTPADLVVLRPPPWWTTGRLLGLIAGLATIALLAALWVMALGRRVRVQTEIIRDRIERETRWVERSRIARDIHDDVGSALTQISLLGDLGRRDLVVDPAIEKQFERISGQAREAVRALDEIVWTVNPRNDTLAGTVAYLNEMIEDMAEDAGLRCRFDIPEDVPEVPLDAPTRHNLLLAAKEAAHNAVKHAGTTVLSVSMGWQDGILRIGVHDDGKGFDPDKISPARTGLDSMQRRMQEVGGTVEVESEAGKGTAVTFRVPLERAEAAAAVPRAAYLK